MSETDTASEIKTAPEINTVSTLETAAVSVPNSKTNSKQKKIKQKRSETVSIPPQITPIKQTIPPQNQPYLKQENLYTPPIIDTKPTDLNLVMAYPETSFTTNQLLHYMITDIKPAETNWLLKYIMSNNNELIINTFKKFGLEREPPTPILAIEYKKPETVTNSDLESESDSDTNKINPESELDSIKPKQILLDLILDPNIPV